MTLLIASIPFMIATIAAVVVPLVAAMRHEHRLQVAALEADATRTVARQADRYPVAA
ncbi:MAG TPA: hypothetical protein VMV02_00070 [Acidimicrobiales bacterium]|nr:hypothetical protein [Acidimicrobiales bacterium]